MNRKKKLLKKWLIVTLCCVLAAFAIPLVTTVFLARDDGPVVIVLDPGHGGSDCGAINTINGLNESDANLAIALACYEELQKYDGVEVYMTHMGLDKSTTMSLGDRITCVETYNADILISLHCNDAESPTAHGAEVFVSHSAYKSSYNGESTALAVEFLSRFRDMGLRIRGVKTRLSGGNRIYYHDDGSVELGDYYAVIGSTIKRYGVPGILVEHAFVTGDYAYLNTPEKLAALGMADAQAIVSYYGLTLRGEPRDTGSVYEPVPLTDRDIASASDVNAALVAMPQYPDAEDYEALQAVRGAYERLTAAGRTLVDADYLDTLYRTIAELDCERFPVRIVAPEESELSINRVNHTVSGLDLATGELAGTNAAALRAVLAIYVDPSFATEEQADLSEVRIEITDRSYQPLDIAAQLGTGCKVCLCRGEEIIDSLTVVIQSDLSGDGACDSRDVLLLDQHIEGFALLDEYGCLAADVNLDGVVDRRDQELLLQRVMAE